MYRRAGMSWIRWSSARAETARPACPMAYSLLAFWLFSAGIDSGRSAVAYGACDSTRAPLAPSLHKEITNLPRKSTHYACLGKEAVCSARKSCPTRAHVIGITRNANPGDMRDSDARLQCSDSCLAQHALEPLRTQVRPAKYLDAHPSTYLTIMLRGSRVHASGRKWSLACALAKSHAENLDQADPCPFESDFFHRLTEIGWNGARWQNTGNLSLPESGGTQRGPL